MDLPIMNMFTQTSSILCFLLHSLSILRTSSSSDTMQATQILRDGDTLVSSGQTFELGFFSPGSSQYRYVGIWYKNISSHTVVWVANRASPLRNKGSGSLRISRSGMLIIFDETTNATLWSTNASQKGLSLSVTNSESPVVQLLDSGNLVLREANTYLWQSFDNLTDTSLPGMDFGWNLAKGSQISLSSWKTNEDPSLGDYSINMDLTGYPQIFIKRDDVLQNRLGPYNGLRLSGMLSQKQYTTATTTLVMNSSEVYYKWINSDISVLIRYTLSPTGIWQLFVWADPSNSWIVYYKFPGDMCDGYGTCGANGNCDNNNFPVCSCLNRFLPKDQVSWGRSDWTGGCIRRTPMNCSGDGFLKYSGIKLPDVRSTRYNVSSSLKECEVMCLSNCSCTAYSSLDITNGGSGCLMWFGDLIDIRDLAGENQVIYIRMAASELGSEGKERTILIAILASFGGFSLLVLSLVLFTWKRRKSRKLIKESQKFETGDGSYDEDLELPMYDLSTMSKATECFSPSNKLGQGGFGPVYKGMLEDGKEIAVKRLSKSSSQGLEEFKNEVICIAKLQHRNLVKLLGCCIEGEEKMLIYEYMPNKSLDIILFDEAERKRLDWLKRLHIIDGIARGLLYLHQDSCLRVIHRDLKASNILLDNEMNPRISDFGMARIFGGNETEGSTSRVVGTYGYMSPEYAVDGFFSTKSDVYSFGVLVLEIVSGRKNRGFRHMDHHHNLVGHAWMLYKEGRSLEIVDPNIGSSVYIEELLRSIHVALLCVQQRPDNRPSMSAVVLMLGSGGDLPEAKEPGFFTERHGFVSENSSSSNATTSSNKYTITQVEGR